MTCPPHVFRPKSFPLHGGSELFCENCGMTKTERDAALAASPPVDQGRIERLVIEAISAERQRQIESEGWTPEQTQQRITSRCCGNAADALEAAQRRVSELEAALSTVAAGSKLGAEMFEQRIRDRKGRLTWWAANVLQDNLDACAGTARAALAKDETAPC